MLIFVQHIFLFFANVFAKLLIFLNRKIPNLSGFLSLMNAVNAGADPDLSDCIERTWKQKRIRPMHEKESIDCKMDSFSV